MTTVFWFGVFRALSTDAWAEPTHASLEAEAFLIFAHFLAEEFEGWAHVSALFWQGSHSNPDAH